MSHAPSRLRDHILLSLIYVATRAALFQAGIQFDFSLDWMWLSDPADLRDRLLETLYYSHAYPPGMNLLTGILLKLGGSTRRTLTLRHLLGARARHRQFALLPLPRVRSVHSRCAALSRSRSRLIPQSIYFEHLFLYEYPITALLCLAAVFFYRGGAWKSFRAWLGFFAVCSAIGLTRSTFHLVWFVAMMALGLWFTERRGATQTARRGLRSCAVAARALRQELRCIRHVRRVHLRPGELRRRDHLRICRPRSGTRGSRKASCRRSRPWAWTRVLASFCRSSIRARAVSGRSSSICWSGRP